MARLPPNFHSYQHGNLSYPSTTLIGPAMGMLPLTRWPLGYQTLSPVQAIAHAFPPLILPLLFWLGWRLTGREVPANEGPQFLWYYIAAAFGAAVLRFLMRALGQYRGDDIHQTETGYSLVAHVLPLPLFFTEQLMMPALLGWAGWKAAHMFSVDLGGWLMVCAVSYFWVANWECRNRLAQRRALVDDQAHASLFAINLDQHEQKAVRRGRGARRSAPDVFAKSPDIVALGKGRRK